MADNVFKEHDPEASTAFTIEKYRLFNYLSSEYKIEHFGSTAVPGLGGKGVIDMYILVPEDAFDQTKEELGKAGYEYKPKSGSPERWFFKRDEKLPNGGVQTYHLYMTAPNSADYRKDILFRNYLRNHPEDVEKYAKTKQKAAKQAQNDKDAYMKLKTPAIEQILKKALAEE